MTCTFHGNDHLDGEPMAYHAGRTLRSLGEAPITSLIKGYDPSYDRRPGPLDELHPTDYTPSEAPPQIPIVARYQGYCATCDGTIHPGELILSGPWRHATCPEAEAFDPVDDALDLLERIAPESKLARILDQPEPEAEPKAEPAEPADQRPPDGTYTIVFEDGGYRTVRLRTNGEDWDFAPGEQILSYLAGPDNETSFQSAGILKRDGRLTLWKRHRGTGLEAELARVVTALLHDHVAAGEAYALRSCRCWRCHRKLTVPASIHRGLGPDCARQLGLV